MTTESSIPSQMEEFPQEDPWYLGTTFLVSISLLCVTLLLLLIYRKMVVILIKTAPRDFRIVVGFIRVVKTLKIWGIKNMSVGKIFDIIAARYPDKVCFYFENEEWTFSQVLDYTNRIANYFQSQGFRKGDNVALIMENKPQFVCIWLGLSKIGVVPALVNYNLRLKSLLHSLEVVKSKAVIYGYEVSEALQQLEDEGLMPILPTYCSGHKAAGQLISLDKSVDLDEAVKRSLGTEPVIKEVVGFNDNLVYIYTSGTTGLPKAAPIKHMKFCFYACGGHFIHNVSEDDIQYTVLPLYHSAGGVLGIGQALLFGTSIVIKRKFSASAFWKDCIRYKVTVAQYIGEICRFLMSQPPAPEDTQHRVRMMYGNGLRREIWADFTKRFGLKRIGEFYGSTEGNCSIVNTTSQVGSVGFFPRLVYRFLPTSLVRVNEETGEILRNKNGRVIQCKPNEAGELIGKIVMGNPLRDFSGYADPVAAEKKIVRDVFSKGDAWFRSGDILVMDEYGNFYFMDRTGDTFRWKGENCSTAEIESVVSNVCGLRDVAAYGVEIAGNEGRAGMVAIADPGQDLDVHVLAEAVGKSLPAYARPLFIRTMKEVELTSTFKLKKVDLQKQGFDINSIKDKIYFLDKGKYVPLGEDVYKKLLSGKMRL